MLHIRDILIRMNLIFTLIHWIKLTNHTVAHRSKLLYIDFMYELELEEEKQ